MKLSWVFALCVAGVVRPPLQAQPSPDLPRLPGSTLLIGSLSPEFLAVTTPDRTVQLLPEPQQPETGDYSRLRPTITRDGLTVAAWRFKSGNPRRVAIATYSVPERKWTEYGEGEFAGTVAISPDGAMLAFAVPQESNELERLHIIKLKTGKETLGPEVERSAMFSWPPDGSRMVYESSAQTIRPAVKVELEFAKNQKTVVVDTGKLPPWFPFISLFDVATGKSSLFGVGVNPVWSPSGEWIAFRRSSDRNGPDRLMIAHPDGTSMRQVALYVDAPVWSPDSTMLLLNSVVDEVKGVVKVQVLDVRTGKVTTRFKDVLPVVGWAEHR